MRFFFLLVFYQSTLALIYDDQCTNKCDFPGLVCVNSQCKCDSKSRLFWTGARCAPCRNDWIMSDTACIGFYESSVPWSVAELVCRDNQAELISLRNRNMIPLLYQPNVTKNLGGWTSARATDLSGLGEYRWLDKSIKPFDINYDWWCKMTDETKLGYPYPYNEPTRYNHTNGTGEREACVVYWRGIIAAQAVCLDDQFCSFVYPFVCEKSESTAKQYLGPAPVLNTNNIPDASVNNGTTPKPKKKSVGFIIIPIIIIGALLLLGLLIGIFFYCRHRNTNRTQFNFSRSSKASDRETSINDMTVKDEPNPPPSPPPSPNEGGLTLGNGIVPENIGGQKQEKNKRGGYSKQQFDEFE